MDPFTLLFNNAIFVITSYFILWLVSIKLKDVSFIDSVWAFTVIFLAAMSYYQTTGSQIRKEILLIISSIWGIRLGGFLLWRWLEYGPDRRYEAILARAAKDKNWSFAKASLVLVFAVQAPILFVVCLPVQLGQMADQPTELGNSAYAGIALGILGIIFETVGDWQLTVFRTNPRNKGKVLNTGLWRYTRHPNYFGDICFWWGLYLIAIETEIGLYSFPGPILMTWLLMKWSGIPTLEHNMKKHCPKYSEYIEKTSSLFPWFPKQ